MPARSPFVLSAAVAALVALAGTAADVTTVTGKKLVGNLVGVGPEGISLQAGDAVVKVPAKELLLVNLGRQAVPPPAGTKYAEVELTDGSVLRVARYAVKGTKLEVEFHPGTKEAPAPTAELNVRQVLSAFRGAEDPKNRDAWRGLLQTRGKRDLYVTRQADGLSFVQGTVVEGDADGKRLTFEKEGGERVDLLQSRATGGLVFYAPAPAELPKTLCKVVDVAGNTLFAQAVDLTADGVAVKTVSGATVRYPSADALARLDFAQGNVAYLSDLELRVDAPEPPAVETKFADGADKLLAGPPPVIRDRYTYNEAIRVDRTAYAKGLTVAPGTVVAVNLNGEYRQFKAVVGFQAGPADTATAKDANREVRVTVEADGRVLFAEAVALKDKPRDLTLDVKGVKRLTVAVDPAPPSVERVVLADARVQK